eukprot:TRINITY_DN1765_c0_g1_i1.p1 TRINITY_DN1765_c0_g1~~TRINITY_DN1765_c0_g1_i1.p1  ORF type:complete len:226 (+),score=58.67 TRINITY_DN1765_c0_g1_i1:159-836(+)
MVVLNHIFLFCISFCVVLFGSFRITKEFSFFVYLYNIFLFTYSVHTVEELNMDGKFAKGARPLLRFTEEFSQKPHLIFLKEMFTQVFGTPRGHPKSENFSDHVMSFIYKDDHIWVRYYQLKPDEYEEKKWLESFGKEGDMDIKSVEEIGPRFCLQIGRIYAHGFSGDIIYQNPDFVQLSELASNQRRRRHEERLMFGVGGKNTGDKWAERHVKGMRDIADESDSE